MKAVHSGHSGTLAEAPAGTNRRLYGEENPLSGVEFAAKTSLLAELDAYAPGFPWSAWLAAAKVGGVHGIVVPPEHALTMFAKLSVSATRGLTSYDSCMCIKSWLGCLNAPRLSNCPVKGFGVAI